MDMSDRDNKIIVIAVPVDKKIKKEQCEELQRIESTKNVDEERERFKNRISNSGVYSYRYTNHERLYGIMSCEPGVKAVLQEEGKIDTLVLLLSKKAMGTGNLRKLYSDEDNNDKLYRFNTPVSFESLVNKLADKSSDVTNESADASQVDYCTGSGAEYFLHEMQSYCHTKGVHIEQVILVDFRYDEIIDTLRETNYDSKTTEEAVRERNDIVKNGAIQALVASQVKSGDKIYIDSSGGIRDTITAVIAAVRLMSINAIKPAGIMTTDFLQNEDTYIKPFAVINNQNMYDVFDLVSGLDEFKSYGRAEKLFRYFKNDDKNGLFAKIEKLGEACLICAPNQMLKAVREVSEKLSCCPDVDGNPSQMKDYIIWQIKEDFVDLLKAEESFKNDNEVVSNNEWEKYYLIPMIEWCINNGLIQQALTLYVEKMPDFFVKNNIIFYKDTKKKSSIAKDVEGIYKKCKKYGYTKEYCFIRNYIFRKPKNNPYYSRIKRNFDNKGEKKDEALSFNNGTCNTCEQVFFEQLIYKGIKYDLFDEIKLLTDYYMNNGSDVASVLILYYRLKENRNHMNHANNQETTKYHIEMKLKEGIKVVKELLAQDKNPNYEPS